jgi:hypothetical protein
LQAFLLSNIFPPVTVAALGLGVFSLELIPRLGVIELFLPALPVDQFEIFPVMLDMAQFALPVFRIRMQALSGRDSLSQIGMTDKAFLAGDLLFETVTFITIIQTLQVRVGIG